MTNYQIIALIFVAIILTGAFLLCLPIASRARVWTPFINAIFTSTSAACVTGLVVYDTFSYWSTFGQLVILTMIQIGGIGFMTIMTAFALFIKRQLTLSSKTLFLQSTGNDVLGVAARLIKQVLFGTLIIEGVGALILFTRFCGVFGFGMGLYMSIWHSISAFCNAGFDLMGYFSAFSSLTYFVDDVVVNLTICALIIVGGLGFIVWSDLINTKFTFKKLSLHSRIVILSTSVLLVGGTLLFMLFEWGDTLQGMSFGNKLLASFFQSVSPRTAGFNTVDMAALSDSGSALVILLMLVGGSPGSTAGGIKTTTIVVLAYTIAAQVRRKKDIVIGKRRLEEGAVQQASATFMLYFCAIVICSIGLCAISDISMSDMLFEVVSAVGTVGLSTGITPTHNIATKIVLIFLMYGGRVGMLSLAMIFANKHTNIPLSRPLEKIVIG